MAPWLVTIHLVPTAALRTASISLESARVASIPWWEGESFPADARAALDDLAPRQPDVEGVERWGADDANGVDVESVDGRVRRVTARVDVRRLDAKFGAGLMMLARRLDASLVRGDGRVLEPTIAAFAAALRGSRAWAHANEGAQRPAGQDADEGDDE